MACGEISELLVDHIVDEVDCPECLQKAIKTFEQWAHRDHMKFPEGEFYGLFEEPRIGSRRELREACKRAGKDEHSECYARIDDGYAGF
jgi:hypothetical protein